jgi:hypothetical protein
MKATRSSVLYVHTTNPSTCPPILVTCLDSGLVQISDAHGQPYMAPCDWDSAGETISHLLEHGYEARDPKEGA